MVRSHDRLLLVGVVRGHSEEQRRARQSAMGGVDKKCERLRVAQGTKDKAYLHSLYSAGGWRYFPMVSIPGIQSKPSYSWTGMGHMQRDEIEGQEQVRLHLSVQKRCAKHRRNSRIRFGTP